MLDVCVEVFMVEVFWWIVCMGDDNSSGNRSFVRELRLNALEVRFTDSRATTNKN